MKGFSHLGDSSSSKGLYDMDSEPRVNRNSEVDRPQESPYCRDYLKHHGGGCMKGSSACYSCRKPSHDEELSIYERLRKRKGES